MVWKGRVLSPRLPVWLRLRESQVPASELAFIMTEPQRCQVWAVGVSCLTEKLPTQLPGG